MLDSWPGFSYLENINNSSNVAFFIKMCFALSPFFLTILHFNTYSMSHNTSTEIQLALHCLTMNNCISIWAQISAVVRACYS